MQPKLEHLITYAHEAGAILRQRYGKKHKVDKKGIVDLVTEADYQSEQYIVSSIQRDFPDHTIVTEEAGRLEGTNVHCWYIDPLDGTINFAHHVPIFTVSIAYSEEGQVLLGVVYDPMRDECFSAARGQGAWLNGEPIGPSDVDEMVSALLVTGFPYEIRTIKDNNLSQFAYFATHAQAVRRLGSAALDLCYVACGRFDGYWELRLKPWDLAAGSLICQEAGGVVTDLDGGPNFLIPPCSLVAANLHMHPRLMQAIEELKKNS
jgi:myo-inositol-1(or 4)-monophosphatase